MTTFEVPFFNNSLKVSATAKGVTEILWQKKKAKASTKPSPLERKFSRSLQSFLQGRGSLDVPIDWKNIEGTEFQKQVWKKMWKIPFGKTQSYGEIAESLKKPGAARAVGTACGKNPILLAIPCHRVVGSNGLGGFSGGGIPVKKKLLEIEGFLH